MFKNKIFIYILFSIVILDISNVTSVPSDYILIVFFLIFAVKDLVVHFFRFTRAQRVIYILFGIWVIINFVSSLLFSTPFKLAVFSFGIVNILLPYYLYSEYKINTLLYLEKIVYFLTIISLPLFLLNTIFPSYFDAVAPLFKPFTRQLLAESSLSYWSIGLYTNALGSSYLRNCGFMWEPGRFAVILIIFIIINWLLRGIKFDKKTIVYSIAIITTFSTAGYLALFVLLVLYVLKKMNWILAIPMLLFFFIIFAIPFYNNTDFLSDKIDEYVNTYEERGVSGNFVDEYNAVKLNRLQIFKYDLMRIIRYPFGYGRSVRVGIDDVDVTGTNGISGMFVMWGIPLFMYFIYNLFGFLNSMNIYREKNHVIILMYISVLVMFFSQNVHQNILLYLMVLFPIVFRKRKLCQEMLIKQKLQ